MGQRADSTEDHGSVTERLPPVKQTFVLDKN